MAAEEEARKAAERQRRLDRLRPQYVSAIAGKVERNWLRPSGVGEGAQCVVLVTQGPGGVVLDVQTKGCTGGDLFRQSVEKAVWKADPLPEPSDPELFERQIEFTFEPGK